MSDRIAELEARVDLLAKNLAEAQQELYSARNEQIGLVVGDKVRGAPGTGLIRMSRRDGVEYVVTSIQHNRSGKPWVRGKRIKKDGGLAVHATSLYGDWEKVEDSR